MEALGGDGVVHAMEALAGGGGYLPALGGGGGDLPALGGGGGG